MRNVFRYIYYQFMHAWACLCIASAKLVCKHMLEQAWKGIISSNRSLLEALARTDVAVG